MKNTYNQNHSDRFGKINLCFNQRMIFWWSRYVIYNIKFVISFDDESLMFS